MTVSSGRAGRVVLGIALFALATLWFGWWSVPVIAAFWGLWFAPTEAVLAALLGWTGLLVWNATTGPILPYAKRLGGIFSLPGWVFMLVTLLFAALLAWSAAVLFASLRRGGR
jgi:hypothetical protein